MAVSLAKKSSDDIESLVDLFLSEDFAPLSIDEDTDTHQFSYEAEADVEEPYEEPDGQHARVEPAHVVHDAYFNKKCGQKLAQLGDEFYRTYVPQAKSDKPWLGVAAKVKNVVTGIVQLAQQGTDAKTLKKEQERAWDQFRGIMANSVAGTHVDDSYKKLGAVLLTLRGLSDLSPAALGYVRALYTRYIRESELNNVFTRQSGSGLDHLMDLD